MNKKRKVFLIFLIVVVFLACLFKYISMFYIPRTIGYEYKGSVYSPDGKYMLNLWNTSGGATSSFSVSASVASIDGKFKKNIFREIHETNIEGYWIDNCTVSINGIILDVEYETYDNRRLDNLERRKSPNDMSAKSTLPPICRFSNRFFCWILSPGVLSSEE